MSVPEPNPRVEGSDEPALTKDQAAQAFQGMLDRREGAEEPPADDTREELEAEAEANPDGEPDGEIDAEPEETEQEQAEEEVELADTLTGLAEQLEIEEDALLDLRTTVKVNGEDKSLTLREALSQGMFQADYSRKTAELADKQRQFDDAVKEAGSQWKQRLETLDQHIATVESLLGQEPNWAELAGDPYEYAEKRAAWDQLQSALRQAKTTRDAEREESTRAEKERIDGFRKEQHDLLYRAMPEMQDRTKADKFVGSLYSEMPSYGFTGQEVTDFISGPWDHRQFLILRDALEHRKAKSEGSVTRKKLAKLSKVKGKRAAREEKPDPATSRVADATRAIKKARSGSREMREAMVDLMGAKLAARDERLKGK